LEQRPVHIPRHFGAVLLAFLVSGTGVTLRAQGTISVTIPARLAAGPDYATEVLGDPWDMCNPQDISPSPDERIGFSSFSFLTAPCRIGGTTTAVNGGADSSIWMLYPGIFDGALNPGRNGRNFPIDTGRYQTLSYKLSSTGTEDPQVYWTHNPYAHPSGIGMGARILPKVFPGTQITVADLTQSLFPGVSPWTNGVVRGFRLDPNSISPVVDAFYHWVRLTPSNSSPLAVRQTITWTGSGPASITVRDSEGTAYVIATSVTSNSYLWFYGFLPPGSYTLSVSNSSGSGSAVFSINRPPSIVVTDPSPTTGEDYATKVLGNPWDMNDASDIQLTGFDYLTNLSFSGGRLHATNTINDPNVTLLSNSNNSVPIDTSKYRYLTFRLQVDGPFDLGEGSVARIFWSSSSQMSGLTATTSQDIVVWPGMNSYTVDLAPLSTAPDGGLEVTGPAEAWGAGNKRHLRFDPHEFPQARTFHLDDVRLTAKPVATSSFTIKFVGADADGDPATAALYYDIDTNPANGRSLITSGIPLSAGAFVWNTAGVQPGEYYIYAEASDGLQAIGRYSTVPVQVVPPGSLSDPLMAIDTPGTSTAVTQNFRLAGWALDRGSASGTGVDVMHFYAFPGSGAAIFLGSVATFDRRDDVGAAFGQRFTNSGYHFDVSGLSPGTYTLVAYAHSVVTGSFNQSRAVVVTVTLPRPAPAMSLDAPVAGATVGPRFNVAGWAIDRGASNGSGVDTVHVYAYPNPGSGQAPIFLGANYGASRPDVGNAFGARFTNSGFTVTAPGLSPGPYLVVAFAHSTVAGTFNLSAQARITVASSVPLMALDVPAAGSTIGPAIHVSGWAIDRAAFSGTGVDTIHVWAFPNPGSLQAPIFLGMAGYGGSRPDVGGILGSQFTNSGFNLDGSGLSPGSYLIVAYAHSAVTGTFNQSRGATVTVR
jgi:hypothetical protein